MSTLTPEENKLVEERSRIYHVLKKVLPGPPILAKARAIDIIANNQPCGRGGSASYFEKYSDSISDQRGSFTRDNARMWWIADEGHRIYKIFTQTYIEKKEGEPYLTIPEQDALRLIILDGIEIPVHWPEIAPETEADECQLTLDRRSGLLFTNDTLPINKVPQRPDPASFQSVTQNSPGFEITWGLPSEEFCPFIHSFQIWRQSLSDPESKWLPSGQMKGTKPEYRIFKDDTDLVPHQFYRYAVKAKLTMPDLTSHLSLWTRTVEAKAGGTVLTKIHLPFPREEMTPPPA